MKYLAFGLLLLTGCSPEVEELVTKKKHRGIVIGIVAFEDRREFVKQVLAEYFPSLYKNDKVIIFNGQKVIWEGTPGDLRRDYVDVFDKTTFDSEIRTVSEAIDYVRNDAQNRKSAVFVLSERVKLDERFYETASGYPGVIGFYYLHQSEIPNMRSYLWKVRHVVETDKISTPSLPKL